MQKPSQGQEHLLGFPQLETPQPASLAALIDDSAAPMVEAVADGGDGGVAGPVYSLELEAAGLAVYIVNGVLAMD